MVVSKSIVAVIEIGGVLTGVLGMFYFTQGLLGKNANYWLRGLLIGLVGGVLLGLILAFRTLAQPAGFAFLGMNAHTPIVGWMFQLNWWEKAAIGFGVGCPVVFTLAVLSLTHPDLVTKRNIATVGLAAILIGLVASANLALNLRASLVQAVLQVVGVAIAVVVMFAVVWLSSRPPRLTDQQLQLFGMAFTLVGAVAALVSPILVMLNIPVR